MGVAGSADELLQAERQQGVDRSRSGAQVELRGGVGQPGPSVGAEQEHALLHGGEDGHRRPAFALGDLEPLAQLLGRGVTGRPLGARPIPLAPSEGESDDREHDGAHRHDDEERVHTRPV